MSSRNHWPKAGRDRASEHNHTGSALGHVPRLARRLLAEPGRAAGALLAGVVVLSLLSGAGCTRAPRVQPLTPEERARAQESFDYVWTTIRDKHWDPELGGVDWEGARAELEPRLAAAKTQAEVRAVLREMIGRLGKSHFGIIARDAYEDLRAPEAAKGDGTAGIEVRMVGGRTLVTRVHPGSGGEEVGVRPGWELLRVGDRDIPELVAKLTEEIKDNPSKRYRIHGAVAARLSGEIGESRTVRFLDGQRREVTVEVPLDEPRGHKVRFGNLPATHTWIDTMRVDDGVGYVAFNFFFDPARVNTTFDAAVRSWMDAPGVIIDLRGNPGGIGAMAMGMAGWFVPEKGQRLGTMTTRASELKFIVSPRPQTYDGPLAILIDGLSASTAEILAGGLKDIGRARLFGEPTAGAALPSQIERLPNGDGFQFAVANYVSQGGEVLEGQGVTPHVHVEPSRARLLAGADPALDSAIAWIRQSH